MDEGSRADALAVSGNSTGFAAGLAALTYAADAAARIATDRNADTGDIRRVVTRVASVTGIPVETAALAVFLQALGDPRILSLPPWLGIETVMRLLLASAPVSAAGVWTSDPHDPLTCVIYVGEGDATRRMQAAARSAIRGVDPSADGRGTIHAFPVMRWKHACAAIVVRAASRDRDRARVFAREATGALGLLLERAALLDRAAARERSLVGASERRHTRLRFDIHDGPLQDIGAALRELRALRGEAADEATPLACVSERLAELEEVLACAEESLRELSQSAEASTIIGRPFRESVDREIASLAGSGIDATVDLRGDFETLTASQRIALTRIVQEALANAREHSGARAVEISIVAGEESVHASVRDDGCGFDVEETMIASARRGRLGLVGMSERVRLLGGRFDITSAPGASTVVTATLPRWRPLMSLRTAQGSRG